MDALLLAIYEALRITHELQRLDGTPQAPHPRDLRAVDAAEELLQRALIIVRDQMAPAR